VGTPHLGLMTHAELALGNDAIQGSQLNVVTEGTGPGPSAAQLLRLLHGQLPADIAVVLDKINGCRMLIGRMPS
jgi:hypothetical protein